MAGQARLLSAACPGLALRAADDDPFIWPNPNLAVTFLAHPRSTRYHPGRKKPMTPEQKARGEIDRQLSACGWVVARGAPRQPPRRPWRRRK